MTTEIKKGDILLCKSDNNSERLITKGKCYKSLGMTAEGAVIIEKDNIGMQTVWNPNRFMLSLTNKQYIRLRMKEWLHQN